MLGSETTLRRLVEASYEEAERQAGLDPRSAARKLAELDNRRSRAMDAYERSDYELPELRKRLAQIDGERAVLRGVLETSCEAIELGPGLLTQVAEVFGSWRFLQRADKRKLLREYRIRIRVSRPKRRILHVDRVDVGLLGELTLYKKMRRLGIQ